MSYNISLLRKEVKEQGLGLEILEKEEIVFPFRNEQFEALKIRLLKYGFKIENESADHINFNWIENTNAMLTKNCLYFSSGFSTDAIFEISMTASEFTDTGEFAKYDPQQGGWEEF